MLAYEICMYFVAIKMLKDNTVNLISAEVKIGAMTSFYGKFFRVLVHKVQFDFLFNFNVI